MSFTSNLSDLIIEINDDPTKIISNTLVFNDGYGQRVVRAESAGAGNVFVIATDDVETKISMVKFSKIATIENLEEYRTWQLTPKGGIVIKMYEPDGSFNIVFRQMTLTSNNDVNLGPEGTFELEFKGPPVIRL